jgi:hypothetical protein
MSTGALIAGAVSLGASAISSLFAAKIRTVNRVEEGKIENFVTPRSSFGDSIPKVWGKARVGGILIYGDFPPEERVSETVTETTQGGKGGGSNTTVTEEVNYTYWGNCAFILCGKTTNIDEIRFNSKLVYKDGQLSPLLSSSGCTFRIYNGTDNQQIDSLLQVKLNDRAIAYRNRTILVCENLPLAEFNNQYPQCSALVRNGDNVPLSTVIQDICLESPYLTIEDLDTDELDQIIVTGYQIDNQTTITEALSKLQQAYFFDLVDDGEKLKFQNQFRPAGLLLPNSELAAHESGEQVPRRYRESRQEVTELPTQIEARFFDVDNNLLEAVIRSPSYPTATHVNLQTVDYPGALSRNQAQDIVNKNLWLTWTRAYTQEFALSPRFANLEIGDVVEVEIAGNPQQVQINQLEYGANHLLLVKSWLYNPAIYGWDNTEIIETDPDYEPSPVPDPIPPVTDTPLPVPAETDLRVLDIPLAYPTDTPGLYVFADGDATWRNAFLYYSIDLGVTYQPVGTIVTRSVFGTCTTTFNGTSVTVQVPFHASLSSISSALFEAGRNRALIGDEILDFQNAALTGTSGTDRIFQLTAPFTRGISGTPQTHGAGEDFYLLSGYKLNIPVQRTDIGKTFYFKAITPGQTLDDVDPVIIVFEGKAFTVVINDFSPRQGAVGITVTITGQGFTGATAVSFNEIAAQSFTVVNDTTITAVVATGTTTGKIKVTAPLGVGVSAVDFTIVQGLTVPENNQHSSNKTFITRHIDVLENKPYWLDVAAAFPYRIDSVAVRSSSGNATVNISVQNTIILSNLAVGTVLNKVSLTNNNTVEPNNFVQFISITSNSCLNVGITIEISNNVQGPPLSSNFANTILSINPISYYLLEETSGNTAVDQISRENLVYPSVGVNNILNQSSLLASGQGKSVQFNPSELSTQLIGNYVFSNSFTIGALIRLNSDSILGRVFGASLLIRGIRAEINLFIGNNPNLSGAGNFLIPLSQNVAFYNSSARIFLNELNFLCLTLNDTQLTIYLNGLSVLTSSTNGNNINSINAQNKFYFGYFSGAGVNSFNLSNVFVCDYALTQSQINTINLSRN